MKVNSSIKPGLYRVFWKTGGSSLAAVGMTADGGRWLAPTNWLAPTTDQRHWEEDVDRLEAIDVPDLDAAIAANKQENSDDDRDG